MPNQNNS
jgi:hypothetical protein